MDPSLPSSSKCSFSVLEAAPLGHLDKVATDSAIIFRGKWVPPLSRLRPLGLVRSLMASWLKLGLAYVGPMRSKLPIPRFRLLRWSMGLSVGALDPALLLSALKAPLVSWGQAAPLMGV